MRAYIMHRKCDKKYVVVRKIEKVVVVSGSRGLQKTELQDTQLGVVIVIGWECHLCRVADNTV